MKPDIITIGNVNLDIIMGPQEPWPEVGTEVVMDGCEFREGGSAGNAALALEALGCKHRLFCSMGNDFMGQWLTERFGKLALDWTYCEIPTTFSVGITHPDGERTFFSNKGHLNEFSWSDVQDKLSPEIVDGTIILFAGGFLSPVFVNEYAEIFPNLRAQGARIALDPGWPTDGWTSKTRDSILQLVPYCDEILFNDVEVCGLMGVSKSELSEACACLADHLNDNATLVVKQGASGASGWRKGEETIHVRGREVDVLDTIGAGDCFNAGYLSRKLAGDDLDKCLMMGVEVATIAISSSPRRYR